MTKSREKSDLENEELESFIHLDRAVDPNKDHILGNPDAQMTLVEYGSYACPACHEAHTVIIHLRDYFGDEMRYVFRHKPIEGNEISEKAAILAEYAALSHEDFWNVHVEFMRRGAALNEEDLTRIATEFDLPSLAEINSTALEKARKEVMDDIESAEKSGAIVTPSFFINGRHYEGAWDEDSLSEAMIGSLGQRLHEATIDFVRWGPSAGIMLLLMSILAIILVNSPIGPLFEAIWATPVGIRINDFDYTLPLLQWVNDGLLSLFFLVVGLEIKREFTVGRLSSRRAAMLPVVASIWGVLIPAVIYLSIVPSGALSEGWGTSISTDTAFAIAIIVMLGKRVPVDLRVFLTATAIVDDLISIIVVAVFYSEGINTDYLLAGVAVVLVLIGLNNGNIYNPIPYAILGITLWIFLYLSGLHPTLSGIIVALIIPTNPPPNLRALTVQAQTLFRAEAVLTQDNHMRTSPSQSTLRTLDNIHDRLESPAAKLLRSVAPWSSYIILPLFALANAGVALNFEIKAGDIQLMMAIFFGLVVGKPVGIFVGSWLASAIHLAKKPNSYSWRQLFGAGVIAGMGFTMSLFIAGHSFPNPTDYSAAKIAIFIASITAGIIGSIILFKGSVRKK